MTSPRDGARSIAGSIPRRSAIRSDALPIAILFGILVAAHLAGMRYFLLSPVERVRSPLHPWFRPTGYIGQSAGILAFALFLFLWLYPLRKRFRSWAATGSLASWLRVHVIAGLCVPLVATLHAAWHFSGLIGLGFGAMMIAWISGLIGRYLYAHIPRSREGVELTLDEVDAQRAALLNQIVAATGLDPELVDHVLSAGEPAPESASFSVPGTILAMLRSDFRRWRVARSLRLQWHGSGIAGRTSEALFVDVSALVRQRLALTQQMRMLDATQRLFGYWHVAHKPMAISALVAVGLHVGVAITLGVTWFR